MKRRILAVIVLYKLSAEDSVSYQSLLRSAREVSSANFQLTILLYDNTPGTVAPTALPPNVIYVADASNNGLATAYNRALTMCIEGAHEWLLTLDQDTELPLDTFQILNSSLSEIDARPDVAAVVPQIVAGGRIVSPNYFAGGAWPQWFPAGFNGIPKTVVYAFNSGSLVRVSALRQIGGYSPWFWLDNSDSYLYRQLSKFGKSVYVAGDLKVIHDFSMLNLQERVSPERYKSILASESAFWDLEMNIAAGLERTARLVGRLAKHLQRNDSPALRRLTLEAVWSRLLRSRKQRIVAWRSMTRQRLGPALTDWVGLPGPMISVCMAAYNGERYIEAQLRSILPQLASTDEIVIVDDASQDATVDVIKRLNQEIVNNHDAPRIILVRRGSNQGLVATFEAALRSATGDVLFLCDNDDLWAPQKVSKVLEVFAKRPEVKVVSTGLTLIDEHDLPVEDSEYLKHRSFTDSFAANLLHNQFQGSAMAFRSTLIREILPFPTGQLFLHDAWIGTRNILTGGETAYIDEPLLLYRRHVGNFSRRLSRWKQLQLRLQLIVAHLRHSFHQL
jgi:glycosyltransferase involved in cell wall biosynthesis